MKQTALKTCCIVALGLALLAPSLRAGLVYDNTTGDLSVRFNPGAFEVGDEINLGGTARTLTGFTFQYYGLTFSGSEKAQLRFYANDGPASVAGPLEPGTLLYDSGLFGIPSTARSTVFFDLTLDNIVVPDTFTWTVQFSDLGPGASAGVDLYNPPTVGNSAHDYWENPGSGWVLKTNATHAMNFGARAEAVPEPSTFVLFGFGGLAALMLLRGRAVRR